LQADRVDNVNAAWSRGDGYINVAPILADRDIVGVAAERDLISYFQRPSVNHVQRALRFVTYVDVTSIGSDCRAMVHFDACDLSDDLIRRRIDDSDIVAGAVRLNDSDLARGCGR